MTKVKLNKIKYNINDKKWKKNSIKSQKQVQDNVTVNGPPFQVSLLIQTQT